MSQTLISTTNKSVYGNLMGIDQVFWSPSIRWKKDETELKIEIFKYRNFAVDLFPEFYYLTQEGISISELLDAFPDINKQEFCLLLNDFLKKKILVNSIMTPAEIFYPQNYIYQNKYKQEIKYDAKELENFKKEQLNRCCINEFENKMSLDTNYEFPAFIANRRSHRTFDVQKKVPVETFKKIMSIFKQINHNSEIIYYYASAGGLYPIDIFLYIKENRVENIDKGIYYYNPRDNSICLVNDKVEIKNNAHYLTNQSIFDDSAISIFFIYNANATMPKYGNMGYIYSFIDTGLMIGALTSISELNEIGLCSIGDMDFLKIRPYLKLNNNQVWIHTVELGLKLPI